MNITAPYNNSQALEIEEPSGPSYSEQPLVDQQDNKHNLEANPDALEIEQPRGHLTSALCNTIINFIGSLSGKKSSKRNVDQSSAMKELPDNVFEVSPMKTKENDEKVVISISDSDVAEEEDPLKKSIIICEDSAEKTKIKPFEPFSVEKDKRIDPFEDICECLSGKHESRQECLTDRRLNELNSHQKDNNTGIQGQVSDFTAEEAGNANYSQERSSLPNQSRLDSNSQESAGLFEGIKETYSESLPLQELRPSNGQTTIQVQETSETVREESIKISIGIQGNTQQRSLSKGPQTKIVGKQAVPVTRENPRKIEVNRGQVSHSKEQKETSLPNRKAVVDSKSLKQAAPIRQNSVNSKTQTMQPPAPKKPIVRQERPNVNIEVKKESFTITSKSSSIVLQPRNSMPNLPNNNKKRKAEEALGRHVDLKQVKKNNAPSAELDKKIHILPQRSPSGSRVETARLLVERKTMDRVGSLSKENEVNPGLGIKCCMFCAGGLEPRTSKMLSCLHKAHTKCYEAMSKKKNSQCPICNSNSATGDKYKHLTNSGNKNTDKIVS